MYSKRERGEMHINLWSENLKGRNLFQELGIGRRIILNLVLNKYRRSVWVGLIRLKIGTSGAVSSTTVRNL
jgi:hypothetical protein